MRALQSQFMGYKDIQNKINPATGPILGGQNCGPIPGTQCTDFLPIPLISKFQYKSPWVAELLCSKFQMSIKLTKNQVFESVRLGTIRQCTWFPQTPESLSHVVEGKARRDHHTGCLIGTAQAGHATSPAGAERAEPCRSSAVAATTQRTPASVITLMDEVCAKKSEAHPPPNNDKLQT